MRKMTKICATIGPACEDLDTLVKMAEAGMNVARLNFSHGDYPSHEKLIKNIRKVEEKLDEPIAIMQDLRGPKIRLGEFAGEIKIKEGERVVLNTSPNKKQTKEIPVDFPGLHKQLNARERILIDDGRVELKINKITGSKIDCVVVEGGMLSSHKGLNLPDSKLDIPALSEKDKKDLKFGISKSVDLVAMSFVRSAKDILDLKFLIKKFEKDFGRVSQPPLRIIAKIELHAAVDNLKEILDVADGVMVARGDLGLEMPAEEVPLVQKKIVDMANSCAKPVIVATQMLDSMRESRRPTRAEVSDVANAVIDHADVLMLSNETAAGKHPVLVVKTMAKIIRTTEDSQYDDKNLPGVHKTQTATDTAISELSRILAEEVQAKLILAASISGETGRLISHVRPRITILVATNTDRVRRQLNLSWGVRPFILQPCRTIEELIDRSIAYIKKNKIAKLGDKMIVVAGEPVGQAGNVNLVEVREIH